MDGREDSSLWLSLCFAFISDTGHPVYWTEQKEHSFRMLIWVISVCWCLWDLTGLVGLFYSSFLDGDNCLKVLCVYTAATWTPKWSGKVGSAKSTLISTSLVSSTKVPGRRSERWVYRFCGLCTVLRCYLTLSFPSVLWHCCLFGPREGHLVCKKLSVGLLMVTVWLELCTSCISSCSHHLHYPWLQWFAWK